MMNQKLLLGIFLAVIAMLWLGRWAPRLASAFNMHRK
jgi:hypothetical protein